MRVIKFVANLLCWALIITGLYVLVLSVVHGHAMYNINKGMVGEIELYGKIVDDVGMPLEGVSIVCEFTVFPDNLASILFGGNFKTKKREIVTDSNGTYKVIGVRGVRLVLRDFSHPAYELAGRKKGWGFSFISDSSERHESDPENPFTISMRKSAPSNQP